MKLAPYSIYSGRGTLTASFSGNFLSLEELLEGSWSQNSSLFIMPGGRDCPYHEDLKGAGNAQIRRFVEKGGIYLGICAGAYYGCKRVEFNKGFPLEVCEERELCFFSGTAVGPAYGKGTFSYTSSLGARAAKITTEMGDFFVFYNGGCTFEGDLTQCKVLARYADLPGQPAAIIECPIGKGKAILSGVHLENSATSLNRKDPHLKPLIPILEQEEEQRIRFWEEMIKPLGLKPFLQSNENADGK